MRHFLAVVAGIGAVLAYSGHPAAQRAPAPATAPEKVEAWIAAVEAHVPGRNDDPVKRLALWTRADMGAMYNELKKQRRESNDLLMRGAVLHAEIAITYRTESGYDLPLDDVRGYVVGDGQHVGATGRTPHWAFGRQLLDSVRANPQSDDFVRTWYRATAAFLQSWNDYLEFQPHVTWGRAILPRDAVLAMYEATMHEAFSEPRYQQAEIQTDSGPPPDMSRGSLSNVQSRAPVRLVLSASNERNRAEDLLRQALRFDPALQEARIRLARLRGLGGDHREAADALRKVLASPLPPVLEYHARMFLGQSALALDQRDDARAAFERASVLFPGAQSPRLALSQIAMVSGRRAEASALLDALQLPAGTMRRYDPFMHYTTSHEPDADALLAEMRKPWTK